MNRFTHAEIVLGLLTGLEPPACAEALVLDRDRLIQLLKNALYELHDLRRQLDGRPAHRDIVERIRYLDGVLGWIKEQRGPDLVLMS
ncbi:MAG TPA: hypothetical protein VGU74_09130, partial [Gemmatimonadales bacterium]|nr:hypothetical protein [Gemmatimonadales bacterium]